MLACMDDQQLPGMPPPWPLRVTRTGDGRAVAVHAGPVLLSAFGADDLEMRDLVICSLTEGSRFQGKTVAAAFGIQPSQVSRIRSRYREHGARGLVHQMGRPPILSSARLRQARLRAGQGRTHPQVGLSPALSPPPGSAPARPAAEASRTPATAMAPEPAASQPAVAPAPARAAGEAAMTGPVPRAAGRARAGRWRGGSSPGRLPAGMRARCWCTPSPTGSAPRAC